MSANFPLLLIRRRIVTDQARMLSSSQGMAILFYGRKEKKRVDWGPMSMFAPPLQWFHQHFNPEPNPARYVALKPYGAKYRIEKVRQGLDFDVGGGGWGGVQIDFENQPKDIHEIFVE